MNTYKIAEDSDVLSAPLPIPGFGVLPINAAVIRGTETILVDSSAPIHRAAYFNALTALVDPNDVRWVFLTHDDRDHSGNLPHLLELCPNATLLTTFVGVGRMSEEWNFSPDRFRLFNDGESLELSGRTFGAVRPPVFDCPGTRGLFDSATGVYYSSDSFRAPADTICEHSGDVDAELYERNFLWFNRLNHPWHDMLDAAKFAAHVDRVSQLHATAIVSSHGPIAHRRSDEICNWLGRIATLEGVPLPTQQDLMALAAAHA